MREQCQDTRSKEGSESDQENSSDAHHEKDFSIEGADFVPVFLVDVFTETRKCREHEKCGEETHHLCDAKREIKRGKLFIRQSDMHEIVRQKTEIETVDHSDDTKGESGTKHAPDKSVIYLPCEWDLFMYEIETHDKRDEASQNQ